MCASMHANFTEDMYVGALEVQRACHSLRHSIATLEPFTHHSSLSAATV